MTLYKEPRGYKGRINDYFDFNPRSKESESTTCKIHDWIKYDREPGNTPIDICRNCDTTKIDGKTYSCNLCEYLGREHSEESKRIAELNQTHTCGKLNPSKSTGLEYKHGHNPKEGYCLGCYNEAIEPKQEEMVGWVKKNEGGNWENCHMIDAEALMGHDGKIIRTVEPICKEEPKSTLREDIRNKIFWNYQAPINTTEEIISLFKDTLLKEIEKVRNNYVMYEIEPYEKDIINLIKNL